MQTFAKKLKNRALFFGVITAAGTAFFATTYANAVFFASVALFVMGASFNVAVDFLIVIFVHNVLLCRKI